MNITVILTSEFGLKEAMIGAGVKRPTSVKKLAISGTLVIADFQFIHTKMRRTLQSLNMKSALLEDNTIPDWAFNHCSGLISVIIPDSTIKIGKCAFWECTNLSSVIIPNTIKEIGNDAFYNCGDIAIATISGRTLLKNKDSLVEKSKIQATASIKRDYLRSWLAQFFPEDTLDEIMDMVLKYRIHLKITNPRRSVLGTYRSPCNRNYHIITMNSDLNKYQFLKTFLHEFAHLLVNVNHGLRLPHGIEWKNTFRQVLHYFIKRKLFPSDIRSAIQGDMVKMYAKSSMGLYSVLKKYGMSEYQRGKIDFCCCHLQTHEEELSK